MHSFYSGQFLTPLWSGPDPPGTAFTASRTPANVTIRPVNRWFNASAFGAPPAGRFGTSAKGTIKGPGVNVWHAGFYKNVAFGEQIRLRWELTATNVLNRQNFSNPQVNITQAANVGVITGVGGVNGSSTGDLPGARSMRMGVRVEW